MKIGILSDSHKKIELLQKALKRLIDDKAEFIIHAGDIVLKESLELLEECKVPYQAVFGNNDFHLMEFADRYHIANEPKYFNISDISVKLMHLPYYLNGDSDLVVFGHTHYFEAEFKNETLYINPGEICGRKKPISEFAMVEYNDKKWRVWHYQKDLQNKGSDYKKEEINI